VALNIAVRVFAKNRIGMVTAESTLVHDGVAYLQLDYAIVAGDVRFGAICHRDGLRHWLALCLWWLILRHDLLAELAFTRARRHVSAWGWSHLLLLFLDVRLLLWLVLVLLIIIRICVASRLLVIVSCRVIVVVGLISVIIAVVVVLASVRLVVIISAFDHK